MNLKLRYIVIFTLFFSASLTIFSRSPKWRDGNHWTLKIGQASGDQVKYEYYFSPGGDTKIHFETGTSRKGDILFLKNRLLLVNDTKMDRDEILDEIEGPMFILRMITKVLESIAHRGPKSIDGKKTIDFVEKRKLMKIWYMDVSGGLPNPWSVSGTIERTQTGIITFDFDISYPNPSGYGSKLTDHYSGNWDVMQPEPQIEDKTSVKNWEAMLFFPGNINKPFQPKPDFDSSVDLAFDTVKDARNYLSSR